MNKLDILRLAVKNILRRKARTVLTVSGVVIGTAAIVVMMSIGLALNSSIEKQASQWGSLTTIEVYKGWDPSASNLKFDLSTVKQFEEIEHVEAATQFMNGNLILVSGKNIASVQVAAIDASKMALFDYKVQDGQLLSGKDGVAIVMGNEIPSYFYNPKKGHGGMWGGAMGGGTVMVGGMGMGGTGEVQGPLVDPMTDSFKLTFDQSYGQKKPGAGTAEGVVKKPAKPINVEVTGFLQPDNNSNYQVFMDYEQYLKLYKDYVKTLPTAERPPANAGKFDQIKVKVDSIDNVVAVQTQMKEMGYQVYSLMEQVKSMQEQTMTIRMILGGLGAISLLVAALGITNTMIMSIYERTREIGIMKVIGCQVRDIRSSFLLEAAFIGFSGGVFGCLLSYTVSIVMNYFATTQGADIMGMGMGGMSGVEISIIPLWLVLAALAFSTVVGIVAGLMPAFRATRLSALEAMKGE